MESRVFKVNPNGPVQYPYYARDNSGNNYVWLVKGETRRGFVKALLIGEHNGYVPFQYECEMRTSGLTKITRARITLLIGSNLG